MLVLAGGGLSVTGALVIFGALTGRLGAMLAAVFKPADLVGLDDGHTQAAINSATESGAQINSGHTTTPGTPPGFIAPGAPRTYGTGAVPPPIIAPRLDPTYPRNIN